MFQLSIVLPSGKVFDEKIDSVAAPGLVGGLEIFSGHAPVVCALKSGKVRIKNKEGKDIRVFEIDSGILEVDATHQALILADQIINDSQAPATS